MDNVEKEQCANFLKKLTSIVDQFLINIVKIFIEKSKKEQK